MISELSDQEIEAAIARATYFAEKQELFRSETFIGVMVTSLLRGTPAAVQENPQLQTRISKPQSVAELFSQKQPRTDLERTLVAGYFLETEEGVESFNADDLSQCFIRAKERLPANINDAVNKNISKGLIMDSPEKKGGKKAWMLTRTGEGFVQKGFGTGE